MNDNIMTAQDYPLATRCPEKIQTPTGKPLTDITLENVLAGRVGPQDVRASKRWSTVRRLLSRCSVMPWRAIFVVRQN